MSSTLTIAAGTPFEIDVYDLRGRFPWASSTGSSTFHDPHVIVIHHTVTPVVDQDAVLEVLEMARLAPTLPYRIPYNFVVHPSGNVYYLNDVDIAWPHTKYYNWATAIAAWGDYQQNAPSELLTARIAQLVGALRAMWEGQRECVVWAHRNVPGNRTACPGEYLCGALYDLWSPLVRVRG